MLTKGEKMVLDEMSKDVELVQAIPGGWWLGNDRISGRIGWSLLRKMLVREYSDSTEEMRRYYLPRTGD